MVDQVALDLEREANELRTKNALLTQVLEDLVNSDVIRQNQNYKLSLAYETAVQVLRSMGSRFA